MSANSHNFYSNLSALDVSLSNLLAKPSFFKDVPADWHIVITDVENSTNVVDDGGHQTINFVATGSIVAVLNIALKFDLSVPFFFGGDGATFIVPPIILQQVLIALGVHQQNVKNLSNLHLRVGTVAVAESYEEGHQLKISKLKCSSILNIPVILGNALAYAEEIIKGDQYTFRLELPPEAFELDMDGMQCRWNKVAPPELDHEIVSLLVCASELDNQAAAFKKVVDNIDAIYGDAKKRGPISVIRLKLSTSMARIGAEMRLRMIRYRAFYTFIKWMQTLTGKLYFKTKNGKKYLSSIVEMADTLVLDGRINTVISGTAAQRLKLQTALNTLEQNGDIIYGLHVSTDSIMSCYVKNMQEDHIHFVDGAGGGYTKAAGMLKKKIANRSSIT